MKCTDGDLPITDLWDEVDLENDIARFGCKKNGRAYEYNLVVTEDWLDTVFFDHLDSLMENGKRIAILSLAPDFLLIVATLEEITRICSELRLDFQLCS